MDQQREFKPSPLQLFHSDRGPSTFSFRYVQALSGRTAPYLYKQYPSICILPYLDLPTF